MYVYPGILQCIYSNNINTWVLRLSVCLEACHWGEEVEKGGGGTLRAELIMFAKVDLDTQFEGVKFESRPATFPEIRYTKRIKVSFMF